jgi:hypothetical protein
MVEQADQSDQPDDPVLVGRLVFRDADGHVIAIAGFTGNTLRFAFVGNLLIKLIDDVR